MSLTRKNRRSNGNPLQYSGLENPTEGRAWWAAVHGVAQSQTRLSDFTFTFHSHASEKEMATHSSVLAWRIPGTGEPGGLLSMRSHRVGHDWSDLAAAAATAATRKNRRKKWTQNIPKLKADETRIRKGKWEKGRCSLWCQRIPGRKMFSKQRLDDGVKSFWKGNKWDSACGSI